MELSNLDYLDFLFKSIHSHTAKIIDISSNLHNNLSDEQSLTSINIDDENIIKFKHATLSPPILSNLFYSN
jgi:hypothetical protein